MSQNTNNSGYKPSVEEGKTLFQQMKDRGMLRPESKQLIVDNLDSAVVAVVAGAAAKDIKIEDPIVILLVLDDSGSMYMVGDETRAGLHNLVAVARRASKVYGVVVVLGIIVFGSPNNIVPLVPFTPVDQLDETLIDKYNPQQSSTALYDGVFYGLTGAGGYGFQLHKDGVRGGRRIMVAVTDTGENDSVRITGPNIKKMAGLMHDLRQAKTSVFALLGLGDKNFFTQMGRKMGFIDKNIRALNQGSGGIAKALELVSQSIEWHSRSQSQNLPMNTSGGEPSMFPEEEEDAGSTFFS